MNRTIAQRKADGECNGRKCHDCEYCFIHPALGVSCGKEYPAIYASIDDGDERLMRVSTMLAMFRFPVNGEE